MHDIEVSNTYMYISWRSYYDLSSSIIFQYIMNCILILSAECAASDSASIKHACHTVNGIATVVVVLSVSSDE